MILNILIVLGVLFAIGVVANAIAEVIAAFWSAFTDQEN